TLFLISGGASSLLVAPRPPVRLEDKVATTELLLHCGASIEELNTVRKHLSRVKGGGLLRQLDCPMLTLGVSDVVGDSPSLIGSGPTVVDPSTYADALAVLDRYRLHGRVPASVVETLKRGCERHHAETVKPTDAVARFSNFGLIASNATALHA